jgi:hypothetical protein
LADHQRFTIDEVNEDGEPIAPKENVHLFVNQCGVIVRDNIPITIREWNKPKLDGVNYVNQRSKDFALGYALVTFQPTATVQRANSHVESQGVGS